jgi:glycolate oxidase iron-sulfur subunit
MQTNLAEFIKDTPAGAEAEAILRRCVHCGFCTATCSSYVLLGDERDSPRGRIYMMKEMFEEGEDASREVTLHIDRCLSCLACMTTCPSGVDYMHLVDLARVHIEETGKRSLKERMARGMLAAILPYPERFRIALAFALFARPFRGLFRAVGLKALATMLDLAPAGGPQRGRLAEPGVIVPEGRRRARVALLTGCAQQPLRPEINDATIRVLVRHGVEVVVLRDQGCCGALVHHIGREEQAKAQAKRNIDVWMAAMSEQPLDAIVINASGCGTMVKDYGHLLSEDPHYAEPARMVSALAVDVTEFIQQIGLAAPVHWTDLRVAYHSACSLQHGQRVNSQPRELLQEAGYTLLEIPEGHICCGSAGTYNILQPELASELRARKLENIGSVSPDVVAAGNIGCITQLQKEGGIPIVHTVELLDWALGGPCPRELSRFESRAHDVRDLVQPDAA